MAKISLNLPVFIASPNDVIPERDIVEEEVRAIGDIAAQQRLLLNVRRWEDLTPGAGAVQPPIDQHLDESELVIVIFWSRVGEGSLYELRRALRRAESGQTDNVFIYFKTAPLTDDQDESQREDVLALKEDLQCSNSALTWEFETPNDFRPVLRNHLDMWLRRWFDLVSICETTLQHSPQQQTSTLKDNRLSSAEGTFDVSGRQELMAHLGALAVERYQQTGLPGALLQPINRSGLEAADTHWTSNAAPASPEHELRAIEAARSGRTYLSPTPLKLASNSDVLFSDHEWFFYFCGVGLAQALARSDLNAVRRRPYPNPVHQYLAAIVPRDKILVVPTLVEWLKNPEGPAASLPIARNFSAYVLGMLGATESQDVLAEALLSDAGQDVATYCITSLGKLRSRRYLSLLTEHFHKEFDPGRRLLIGQAICRILGIASFEL